MTGVGLLGFVWVIWAADPGFTDAGVAQIAERCGSRPVLLPPPNRVAAADARLLPE
jgi:hypothetical protein